MMMMKITNLYLSVCLLDVIWIKGGQSKRKSMKPTLARTPLKCLTSLFLWTCLNSPSQLLPEISWNTSTTKCCQPECCDPSKAKTPSIHPPARHALPSKTSNPSGMSRWTLQDQTISESDCPISHKTKLHTKIENLLLYHFISLFYCFNCLSEYYMIINS